MLTPDNIKTLIILAKRAKLRGEEAAAAADAIQKAEALFRALTTPKVKNDGNDADPT